MNTQLLTRCYDGSMKLFASWNQKLKSSTIGAVDFAGNGFVISLIAIITRTRCSSMNDSGNTNARHRISVHIVHEHFYNYRTDCAVSTTCSGDTIELQTGYQITQYTYYKCSSTYLVFFITFCLRFPTKDGVVGEIRRSEIICKSYDISCILHTLRVITDNI